MNAEITSKRSSRQLEFCGGLGGLKLVGGRLETGSRSMAEKKVERGKETEKKLRLLETIISFFPPAVERYFG